jgi:hypothetical protein
MNMTDKTMVDVEPLILDLKPELLAELIRERVMIMKTFAQGTVGRDRQVADEEVERLLEWLDLVMMRSEDQAITLLVVEQAVAQQAAAQATEVDFDFEDGRKDRPIC